MGLILLLLLSVVPTEVPTQRLAVREHAGAARMRASKTGRGLVRRFFRLGPVCWGVGVGVCTCRGLGRAILRRTPLCLGNRCSSRDRIVADDISAA